MVPVTNIYANIVTRPSLELVGEFKLPLINDVNEPLAK